MYPKSTKINTIPHPCTEYSCPLSLSDPLSVSSVHARGFLGSTTDPPVPLPQRCARAHLRALATTLQRPCGEDGEGSRCLQRHAPLCLRPVGTEDRRTNFPLELRRIGCGVIGRGAGSNFRDGTSGLVARGFLFPSHNHSPPSSVACCHSDC